MANKPTQPLFPLGLATSESSELAGFLNTGTIEHGPDAVMTVPEGTDTAGLPSAIRYNSDSDQFEGYYENGGWLPMGGGGIRWEVLPPALSSNLLEGRGYLVNNTDGVSTVVLPSPTRVGDSVSVCDLYGKFSVYPLTVSGGTFPVYGAVEDMTISTDNVAATFTWTGPERGWVITSGVGLGQGRVYSRTIYTQILSADTTQVTLSVAPSIVDVYADGKRLVESKYTLDGNNVDFSPALPAGTELQIIEYVPIQLGSGGSSGGGGTVITWIYNGGSAVGGETEITIDVVVESLSEIFINGIRQQQNLGFTFDAATSKITLADTLEAGDEVVILINGDPTVYNQIDRTPQEVARAYNFKNNQVILSTDTTTILDGRRVIWDATEQRSWGLPTSGIPAGATVVSVVGSTLTYKSGSTTGTVTLTTVPGSAETLANILYGDTGAEMIGFKISGAAGAVKRTLAERALDKINVKDFGARGDWNKTTQTGTNDTAAVAAAIAFITTLGTRRTAGKMCLYFPAGCYRLDQLVLPASSSFGWDVRGDGWMSTGLCFPKNPTDPNQPAIEYDVEFCNFSEIMFFGSLVEGESGGVAAWRPVGIVGKLPDNRADIDAVFTNCGFQYFQDFFQSYGRSVVFNGGLVGLCKSLLTVMASPDIVWDPTGNPYGNSQFTGMRHYTFRGLRTDNCSRLLTVAGTGVCKDYINDVIIVGNDFFFTDIMIDAADATIRRLVVTGNVAIESFATGVLQMKSVIHGTVIGNNFSKGYDDFNVATRPIRSLLRLTGNGAAINISNNQLRCVSQNIVDIGGTCTMLTMDNNQFVQAWDLPEQLGKFVVYCTSNIPQLKITNNSFLCNNTSVGSFNLFSTAQNDSNTFVDGNTANFRWSIGSLTYTPVVTGADGTWAANGLWKREGDFIEVEFMLIGNSVTTATGSVTFSLPVPPVAINTTLTSSYAGGGTIDSLTGFTMTGAAIGPIKVNPNTGFAELYRNTNLVMTNLSFAERTSANVTIFGRLRYKA